MRTRLAIIAAAVVVAAGCSAAHKEPLLAGDKKLWGLTQSGTDELDSVTVVGHLVITTARRTWTGSSRRGRRPMAARCLRR